MWNHTRNVKKPTPRAQTQSQTQSWSDASVKILPDAQLYIADIRNKLRQINEETPELESQDIEPVSPRRSVAEIREHRDDILRKCNSASEIRTENFDLKKKTKFSAQDELIHSVNIPTIEQTNTPAPASPRMRSIMPDASVKTIEPTINQLTTILESEIKSSLKKPVRATMRPTRTATTIAPRRFIKRDMASSSAASNAILT